MAEEQVLKRKREKKPPRVDEAEPWLMTYGDMVTLMMTFFILLFSMSTIDPVKLEWIAEGVGGSKGKTAKKISIADIHREVKRIVAEQNLQDKVQITTSERGVTINLKGDVAFASGSADLTEEAKTFLRTLAPEITRSVTRKPRPFPVAIEGHSDNIPIRKGGKFSSNYALSTARSTSTVEFLFEEGVPKTRYLKATGYGEMVPVDDNSTPEGRAKNRRIEIIFLTVG